MSRSHLVGVSLALAFWACSTPAHAEPGCSLDSLTGPAFGFYDPLSFQPTTTLGSINLCCTEMGSSSVLLELSTGHSGDATERSMVSGGNELVYNLFLDAAYAQVWGDGSNGTARYEVAQPADGCTSLPVYGRMPARQPVPAGAYSDTLTVTLTF